MRSRVFLFSVLALLLGGTVAGGVVSARLQEGMRVAPNEPAEAEYGAMGAGGPTREALTNRPIDCDKAYAAYCDTIPLEIVPPTALQDDRDIFFTIVELHWDGASGNDLDLGFWDNGQSTGSTEKLGSSESTKNPEVVRVANADLEQYNLTVVNTSGANTGYKITARISMDPFENPNESLAPEPQQSPEDEAAEEEDFTPPDDLSGEPTPTDAPDPTLPPVMTGGGGDEDFDFGFSDLENRITISEEDLLGSGAGQAAPRVKETVSPAVLLASLVGAPALIVGSGAAFAWKRRRTLLL